MCECFVFKYFNSKNFRFIQLISFSENPYLTEAIGARVTLLICSSCTTDLFYLHDLVESPRETCLPLRVIPFTARQ